MKLKINWKALWEALKPVLLAAVRAVWPFIAGAVGGLFAGCTVGGIGPNFFG